MSSDEESVIYATYRKVQLMVGERGRADNREIWEKLPERKVGVQTVEVLVYRKDSIENIVYMLRMIVVRLLSLKRWCGLGGFKALFSIR